MVKGEGERWARHGLSGMAWRGVESNVPHPAGVDVIELVIRCRRPMQGPAVVVVATVVVAVPAIIMVLVVIAPLLVSHHVDRENVLVDTLDANAHQDGREAEAPVDDHERYATPARDLERVLRRLVRERVEAAVGVERGEVHDDEHRREYGDVLHGQDVWRVVEVELGVDRVDDDLAEENAQEDAVPARDVIDVHADRQIAEPVDDAGVVEAGVLVGCEGGGGGVNLDGLQRRREGAGTSGSLLLGLCRGSGHEQGILKGVESRSSTLSEHSPLISQQWTSWSE